MLGKLLTKTACGILVGLTGILFMGYCVYFDYKRHLDPDFKKKLHQRRRRSRLVHKDNSGSPIEGIPDLSDHNEIERFFVKQVQMGESRIVNGDLEGAVDHFINAVVVCNQPTRLLQVLQGVLPPEVFNKLIARMQTYDKITRKATILHG
ncbi:mitochondrial import receptor subunit TOM20 homolog [Drosophila tropicalis]|uniref:mitochondrial import receptor subunit TOM20 homolog n=1 Tax=Drosophila tropicalis TaxID=46794 RepID=UPI0035ABF08E